MLWWSFIIKKRSIYDKLLLSHLKWNSFLPLRVANTCPVTLKRMSTAHKSRSASSGYRWRHSKNAYLHCDVRKFFLGFQEFSKTNQFKLSRKTLEAVIRVNSSAENSVGTAFSKQRARKKSWGKKGCKLLNYAKGERIRGRGLNWHESERRLCKKRMIEARKEIKIQGENKDKRRSVIGEKESETARRRRCLPFWDK